MTNEDILPFLSSQQVADCVRTTMVLHGLGDCCVQVARSLKFIYAGKWVRIYPPDDYFFLRIDDVIQTITIDYDEDCDQLMITFWQNVTDSYLTSVFQVIPSEDYYEESAIELPTGEWYASER